MGPSTGSYNNQINQQEWTTVDRRKRVTGGGRVGRNIVSFYVTNIPEEASKGDIQEAVKSFGKLTDVFIPAKKNKGGMLFGFIRFVNNGNKSDILLNLNKVLIKGAKLSANIAKFDRDGKKFSDAGVSDSTRFVSRPFIHSGQNLVKGRSYKDAVFSNPGSSGSSCRKSVHLPYFASPLFSQWKGQAAVVQAKSMDSLSSLDGWLTSVDAGHSGLKLLKL